MNMEEKARLSFYQELTPIDSREHVMLVMHIQTKKIFVKKILTDYNLGVYERLRQENHLQFPHIAALVEDGQLYLIEEYVDGETLAQMIETQGAFSPAEAAEAMSAVCRGVAFLHAQNPPIIHRDLKPSNLMLDKDGVWKIIDLNTARFYDAQAERDTEYLGTKGFAAPEQFGFTQTDVRTDIYALGVLYHYMLTGESNLEKAYEGPERRIVEKCTMFEPGRRYQSVGELLTAIEDLHRSEAQTVGAFPYDPAPMPQGVGEASVKARQEASSSWKDAPYKEEPQSAGQREGRSFLPPGFRSLRPWKMLLGTAGYLFLGYLCVNLEVKDNNGIPLTGGPLIANRIAMFVWLFLTILLGANYLGIQERFPLTSSRYIPVRILGIFLYSGFILFVVLIILTLLPM